jgi:hypothetical protein
MRRRLGKQFQRGWERDMNLNVKSAFFLTLCCPFCRKRFAMRLAVNIGSISAFE